MDGLMVVDAHVTRTGMKISSTLHTSTFLDGKVQIDGGKLVDIAFNTPKEKIEVIDVSTKFFYLEDDQEIQKEVEETVESEGCVRIVSGIEACSDITYTPSSATSPRFPLTGPTSLHLYFKKTDTQTGYILRFVRETNEIRFLFDTPESQVDHKVQLTISKENQAINFDLQTPCISIQGNGEYTWKRNNKNMKLTLSVDNSERYTLETGLQESRGDIMKIEPMLIISSPRGEIINSRGKFQANTAGAKYAAEVTVSGVTASPVIIRGSYEGEDKSAGVTFVLDTPIYDINFKGQIGHEENFVTSKADIEYTTLEGDRHMIHHSGLYKWETSEELTTYSMNFVLNPTQFPEMSLLYDYKIMISKGRLEVSGELTIGPITYYVEEVYSYTNENNHLDFSLRTSMKCPYYQFDILAYKELKIGPNYVNSKLMTRHAPGKEYLLTVDLNKNEDVELSGRISVQCEEGTLTTEVLLSKIASGHYKAQGIAKVITTEEMTWKLEGTVQNKSIPEKVHILMDGNYESPVNAVTVHSGIYADREKATVDFKTDINDQKFSMTIEGTRSSLLVDASIYRHILINAYINTVNEVQKLLVSVEWDKDVDPTKTFTINGELSPSGVGAGFKFAEMEMTASCRLVNNGVELAAMWAPDKRVLAHVHYSLDDTKSLAITVETPFQGWEKQDATFTVSLKDYEITSRAAATWKNAEQMALTINGKFQPGLSNNALKTQILFSSSFENFERITFTVDHTMAGATINTNIVGLWNKNEMKGNFQLTPNETGVDARATFISPFTEEVLVTLHHELHDMALTTKLEAKYGAETSTITMKGHVDLGDVHDITLVWVRSKCC
ncbi:Apolipophorins-like 4, partial [Homarus americanus]